MFEKFAETARSAVTFSVEEASRRGDRRVGTDHLLLGVLHDPQMTQILGVNLDRARAELQTMDEKALSAIGLNIGEFTPPTGTGKSKRAQFGSGAKAILPRALSLAVREKSRRIESKHLLLALLECERPDPAAVLVDELKVDRMDVRAKAALI